MEDLITKIADALAAARDVNETSATPIAHVVSRLEEAAFLLADFPEG